MTARTQGAQTEGGYGILHSSQMTRLALNVLNYLCKYIKIQYTVYENN